MAAEAATFVNKKPHLPSSRAQRRNPVDLHQPATSKRHAQNEQGRVKPVLTGSGPKKQKASGGGKASTPSERARRRKKSTRKWVPLSDSRAPQWVLLPESSSNQQTPANEKASGKLEPAEPTGKKSTISVDNRAPTSLNQAHGERSTVRKWVPLSNSCAPQWVLLPGSGASQHDPANEKTDRITVVRDDLSKPSTSDAKAASPEGSSCIHHNFSVSGQKGTCSLCYEDLSAFDWALFGHRRRTPGVPGINSFYHDRPESTSNYKRATVEDDDGSFENGTFDCQRSEATASAMSPVAHDHPKAASNFKCATVEDDDENELPTKLAAVRNGQHGGARGSEMSPTRYDHPKVSSNFKRPTVEDDNGPPDQFATSRIGQLSELSEVKGSEVRSTEHEYSESSCNLMRVAHGDDVYEPQEDLTVPFSSQQSECRTSGVELEAWERLRSRFSQWRATVGDEAEYEACAEFASESIGQESIRHDPLSDEIDRLLESARKTITPDSVATYLHEALAECCLASTRMQSALDPLWKHWFSYHEIRTRRGPPPVPVLEEHNLCLENPLLAQHCGFCQGPVRSRIHSPLTLPRHRSDDSLTPVQISKSVSDSPRHDVQEHQQINENVKESQFDNWGKEELASWKQSAGKSKEWRRGRYTQAIQQVTRHEKSSDADPPLDIDRSPVWGRWPLNVLRRNRDSKFELKHGVRKVRRQRPCYFAGFIADPYMVQDNLTIDGKDSYWETQPSEGLDMPPARPLIPVSSHAAAVHSLPRQRKKGVLRYDVPYENWIGAVLASTFRVTQFLRNEGHGEVYAVEELCGGQARYEAKAFVLRQVQYKKEYKYRIRNLTRLAAKASFVCSFDHNGRKFVVNTTGMKEDASSAPSSKIATEIRNCNLGAIGRRGTVEYHQAFPKLISPRQPIALVQSNFIGVEKTMPSQELPGTLDFVSLQDTSPLRTYGKVLSLERGYAAVLIAQTHPHELDGSSQRTTGKTTNPEQAERKRERQCLARQKKRARKRVERASDSAVAETPMDSQTKLDKTMPLSGPPTVIQIGVSGEGHLQGDMAQLAGMAADPAGVAIMDEAKNHEQDGTISTRVAIDESHTFGKFPHIPSGPTEIEFLRALHGFSQSERKKLSMARDLAIKEAREARMKVLVKFSKTFKLYTSVPEDLVVLLRKWN